MERWTAERDIAGTHVEVIVARLPGSNGHPGPVVVTCPQLGLVGKIHRYHQHVDPVEVADYAQTALEDWPDDLCFTSDCRDARLAAWERLVYRLGEVPCQGPRVVRKVQEVNA